MKKVKCIKEAEVRQKALGLVTKVPIAYSFTLPRIANMSLLVLSSTKGLKVIGQNYNRNGARNKTPKAWPDPGI